MAAVFSALQSLMAFKAPVNCFPWDYHMRRVEYGVIIACTLLLGLDTVIIGLECTISNKEKYEREYVGSFCANAPWHSIEKRNSTHIYDKNLRRFKWLILLPPACLLVITYLYNFSNLMENYVNTGNDIMEIGEKKKKREEKRRRRKEEKKTREWKEEEEEEEEEEDAADADIVDKTFFDKLERSRDFVGEHIIRNRKNRFTPVFVYCSYTLLCIVGNAAAAFIFYPGKFRFPPVIACEYTQQDLSKQWATCSLTTSGISNFATKVIFATFIFSILLEIFSFIFLFLIFPNHISRISNQEFSLYAEDAKHLYDLREWLRNNKDWINSRQHTCYMLSMLYFHVDRKACRWMSIAFMDVKKNIKEYIILHEIAKLFHITVDKVLVENSCVRPFYRTMITDIEAIACNTDNQDNLLEYRVQIDDHKPNETTPLITNKDCQVIPKDLKDWYEMLSTDAEYCRNLFYLYELHVLPYAVEIEYCSYLESPQNSVSDSSHAEGYDADNIFDRKWQYCWRSIDTNDVYITRIYSVEYQMCLLAIQAPHQNTSAAPTKFSITYGEETTDEENPDITEHITGVWVKDEWKLFPLRSIRYESDGQVAGKSSKCIKITMLCNGGEDFYEIQKIRLFGKK